MSHHPLGPSTLSRRAACPGSYAAELPLWDTPEEEREEAVAGTVRHVAASGGLITPEFRTELLASLREPADRSLVETWWAYWDGAAHVTCEVLAAGVETRLSLSRGRHGTCDAWMVIRTPDGRRVLIVGDLKAAPAGRPDESLQLADYAVGLSRLHEVDECVLVLVDVLGIHQSEASLADCEARVEAVLDAATAPDAERRPGAHCAYCRARDACEVRQQVAVQSAGLVAVIRDPVAYVAALPAAERTAAVDAIVLAAKSLAAAEDALKDAIRDERLSVPLYRLQATTRQEWRDAGEARAALLALASARGVSADEITPLVSPSVAQRLLGREVESLTTRRAGTTSVRRAKTPAPPPQPVIAASPMTAAGAEDPLFTGGGAS